MSSKPMTKSATYGFCLLLVLLFSAVQAAPQKCLICHGKKDLTKQEETGRTVSLYVDTAQLQMTVHGGRDCADCHIDIVEIPHKQVKKVNCRRCHYVGNPVGAPEGELYDQYEHSVHGLEVARGNPRAPVCKDCHGSHDIIRHDSTTSRMYKQNIPQTCGRCHMDVYAAYRESVHGTALARGNMDSPSCASCHGEHSIQRPEEPGSKVSAANVTRTCSDCHGPKGVASKYGIKTDRAATFEESFHGVAQMMESRMVANCASCHGNHDVRPHDDPKSSVHPDNIPATCGKPGCHPDATVSFASGKIHIDPKSKESGILYYISRFFMILTVSTLVGLFVFIILDLFRRARKARAKR
jgi:nitrate/TMAO reductase-like tetraheme cytochrome c subunit